MFRKTWFSFLFEACGEVDIFHRRKKWPFLCEDDIHHRAVSRNAGNMTQLVLFWDISPDFPMSC